MKDNKYPRKVESIFMAFVNQFFVELIVLTHLSSTTGLLKRFCFDLKPFIILTRNNNRTPTER